MKASELRGVLTWKRPGEGYRRASTDPMNVTMDDVTWLAATPKPTQAEVDAWFVDYVAQGIEEAREIDRAIDGEKVVKAIVLWANGRANDAAAQWNGFRTVVANAATLADIKAGVAAASDLDTQTGAEAKAAILAIYRTL